MCNIYIEKKKYVLIIHFRKEWYNIAYFSKYYAYQISHVYWSKKIRLSYAIHYSLKVEKTNLPQLAALLWVSAKKVDTFIITEHLCFMYILASSFKKKIDAIII